MLNQEFEFLRSFLLKTAVNLLDLLELSVITLNLEEVFNLAEESCKFCSYAWIFPYYLQFSCIMRQRTWNKLHLFISYATKN